MNVEKNLIQNKQNYYIIKMEMIFMYYVINVKRNILAFVT